MRRILMLVTLSLLSNASWSFGPPQFVPKTVACPTAVERQDVTKGKATTEKAVPVQMPTDQIPTDQKTTGQKAKDAKPVGGAQKAN